MSSDRQIPSVDESEAVRRGRSFGSILKPSTNQAPQVQTRDIKLDQPSHSKSSVTPREHEENTPFQNLRSKSPEYEPDQHVLSDANVEEDESRGRKRSFDDSEQSSGDSKTTTSSSLRPRTTSKTFDIKPKVTSEQSTSRERAVNSVAIDRENEDDMERAQRLKIYEVTDSKPYRVLRTLVRGDYSQYERIAGKGEVRLRKYLLAANLKEEATYAIKWTIGSILRDGDTLFVFCAIDKDMDIDRPGEGLGEHEVRQAMQETTADVAKMTEEASSKAVLFAGVKNILPGSRKSSVAADARASAKQQDRMHALDKLVETCVGFLRKTVLQVRVVVEVVHCKDCRHMLTEAIDHIQPTMVIVGSRGRSLVRGTIAGSVSQYLIVKSSVPVMTARKKLAKNEGQTPLARKRRDNNIVPDGAFKLPQDVKDDEMALRRDNASKVFEDVNDDELASRLDNASEFPENVKVDELALRLNVSKEVEEQDKTEDDELNSRHKTNLPAKGTEPDRSNDEDEADNSHQKSDGVIMKY
ncbi:uncharacterized protein KY384_004438 [Bacidia gigantensis]|uniref:uncharacterized protein n=1 Tax=Bacidia gigantensis TaxID=2732470 RepID=UPI001D04E20F|nr:uncharacterized protein KY384_004438 [Bacidia gigantensis]KAG8531081.1 hypothetical protein KY384_004438 [Bacidia gigantensis]